MPARRYITTMSPQPKGDLIKLIGDSSKKSLFNSGIIESAFMPSALSKASISPTASEYLLSLFWLLTVIV